MLLCLSHMRWKLAVGDESLGKRTIGEAHANLRRVA